MILCVHHVHFIKSEYCSVPVFKLTYYYHHKLHMQYQDHILIKKETKTKEEKNLFNHSVAIFTIFTEAFIHNSFFRDIG